MDAFAIKAAHYLLKPFSQAQFDEAMNRVMAQVNISLEKEYFDDGRVVTPIPILLCN